MYIAPISFSNFQYSKPKAPVPVVHFGADRFHRGAVVQEDGTLWNRNTTCLFRGDFSWSEFRKYLKERFGGCESVSTRVYGCSKGEEPYSLAIAILEEFNKDARKFFPIIAKDVDPKVVSRAQRLKTTDVEFSNIECCQGFYDRLRGRDARRYFDPDDDGCELSVLRQRVRDTVMFSKANILNDINSIDSTKPSIIFCRNMWPYIKTSEYDRYAKKLFEKLKSGSIVVIGAYEFAEEKGDPIREKNFAQSLVKSGFEENMRCKTHDEFPGIIYEKN